MGEGKRRKATGSDWGQPKAYRITGMPPALFGGDQGLQGTATNIVQAILNRPELHRPIFRPDIKGEAQTASTPLPLVYIWNEDPRRGSFTISVNGRIVGELLEQQLPRSNPRFGEVRDWIIHTVRDVSQKAVLDMCSRSRALPSRLFSLAPSEEGPMTA